MQQQYALACWIFWPTANASPWRRLCCCRRLLGYTWCLRFVNVKRNVNRELYKIGATEYTFTGRRLGESDFENRCRRLYRATPTRCARAWLKRAEHALRYASSGDERERAVRGVRVRVRVRVRNTSASLSLPRHRYIDRAANRSRAQIFFQNNYVLPLVSRLFGGVD